MASLAPSALCLAPCIGIPPDEQEMLLQRPFFYSLNVYEEAAGDDLVHLV